MLYARILTAILLIPLVLAAVIFSHTITFALLSGLLFLWMGVEWANLCFPATTFFPKAVFLVLLTTAFFVLYTAITSLWPLIVGTLFWLIPYYFVKSYRGKTPYLFQNTVLKAFIGIFSIAVAWYALNTLKAQEQGSRWIILLLLLIWSADTCAYFVGKAWGKEAFSPLVSPNKTWQGFWGALIGGMFVATLCYPFITINSNNSLPIWFSVAYITILLAVLGDLFESFVKRVADVKDSGTILPGHGGILDRLDSLIAALPFYAFSIVWLQGG